MGLLDYTPNERVLPSRDKVDVKNLGPGLLWGSPVQREIHGQRTKPKPFFSSNNLGPLSFGTTSWCQYRLTSQPLATKCLQRKRERKFFPFSLIHCPWFYHDVQTKDQFMDLLFHQTCNTPPTNQRLGLGFSVRLKEGEKVGVQVR